MDKLINEEKKEPVLRDLQDDDMFIMDKLRVKWDRFSLQSDAGSWIIKGILAVMIFLSLRAICYFGLQFEQSAMTTIYGLMQSNDMILLGAQALIALVWMVSPGLSVLFFVIALWCSMAGISPVLMTLAAFLLLISGTEYKTVSAAALLSPALIFCMTEEQWVEFFGESAKAPLGAHMLLTTGLGVFILLVASYSSVRMVGGAYGSVSFVNFVLMAMSFGLFGSINSEKGGDILGFTHNYWHFIKNGNGDRMLEKSYNDFIQYLLQPTLRAGALFLIIALIFIFLSNLRIKGKGDIKGNTSRLPLDVRDGIAFAVVGILLCAAGPLLTKYAGFVGYKLTTGTVLIQTVAAYVFTRLIAGRTPTRAVSAYSGKRNFVFISYAHNDLARVKPYLKMLEREGYDYWYDDSIQTGTEWQGVIASNLADCACFFAFISKSSVQSEYCLKEINYATSKNKPIAVILLDDVPLPPVLEMHLASLQAVQRSKFSDDEACMREAFQLEALKNCKY